MKILLVLVTCTLLLIGCKQAKQPLMGETEFQRKLNAEFKDASTSPLKDNDRKQFYGLDFFKFDSAYVVTAQLIPAQNTVPFKMETTTSRLPEYIAYGELHFKLKGQYFNLTVYQNLELMQQKAYNDYLFLPFLDDTNGIETYAGGRYIDIVKPNNNTVVIDFNTAYNPYCAYNETYSCPVVPQKNYLKTRVESGVKAFKK